jgi:hypothetical protein|tara:strand:- start:1539 stop:1715 length:177 start_codon:yes stop_codon:yes gene_type:complete
MKKYIIEFTHGNGEVEVIEFDTDRSYEWTVDQFSRNRNIVSDKLISESSVSSKRMLLD